MTWIYFSWLKQFLVCKKWQSKQLLFCNVLFQNRQKQMQKIPTESRVEPERRIWLTSKLLALFVMFWPNTPEILPKVWSPCYLTSSIQAGKHGDRKWWRKYIRRPVFRTTCVLWNCKHAGSRCHPRTWTVQCEQKGERGKKMETRSAPIFWKLICDPLMRSSSFGIKLNVQRYLSVGISLIAPREVSDRLMQVLTWASPRTLYMYPATDRYC